MALLYLPNSSSTPASWKVFSEYRLESKGLTPHLIGISFVIECFFEVDKVHIHKCIVRCRNQIALWRCFVHIWYKFRSVVSLELIKSVAHPTNDSEVATFTRFRKFC